jgi:hypothetical protein
MRIVMTAHLPTLPIRQSARNLTAHFRELLCALRPYKKSATVSFFGIANIPAKNGLQCT